MNERFSGESRNDEDRDAIAREFHTVAVSKHSDRDRDRGDGRTSIDGILDDVGEDNVSCSSLTFRFDRLDQSSPFASRRKTSWKIFR